MKNNKIHVLLIEDDKVDQMAFKRLVKEEKLPYRYSVAGSVSEARRVLDSENFDLIVADYNLGDGTAFDLFDTMGDTPVVFVTGCGDEKAAVKAMKAGVCDYLIKDHDKNYLSVLPLTIDKAIENTKAAKQFQILSQAIMSINDSVYITDMDDRIMFVKRRTDSRTMRF
jgi:DNA-binding NtrC family response regulator